jgi:hypothetical protein
LIQTQIDRTIVFCEGWRKIQGEVREVWAKKKEKLKSQPLLFFIYIYICEKIELTLIEIDYNNKIMTKY